MTRHNDTPYAKPMTRTLGREALSKGPQAQSLIFVLTTYALDPNRAALTRLLIDLGQKFMLVPIERFTDKPLSNATTDLILIDALHLSHAGHEHRLTHLLNEHPGARAVVSDTFNPRLSPNPKRLVSHRQLAHELHSSPESFNRSGPEKAPTEISNQMLSRQASPKVPQGIAQPASDLALMPGKPNPCSIKNLRSSGSADSRLWQWSSIICSKPVLARILLTSSPRFATMICAQHNAHYINYPARSR